MQITIDIPDSLAHQLQENIAKLPEILERGLWEVQSETVSPFSEGADIINLLAAQPDLQTILSIRPAQSLQDRMSELLAIKKERELLQEEQAELDRYFWLEHLVRLAKGNAYRQLKLTA